MTDEIRLTYEAFQKWADKNVIEWLPSDEAAWVSLVDEANRPKKIEAWAHINRLGIVLCRNKEDAEKEQTAYPSGRIVHLVEAPE